MAYDPVQFAEKYRLAVQSALETKPNGGVCGFEQEWNLLDAQFRPLLTVGSGPDQQSFVDYLRSEAIPAWLRDFSQLEVFHWMIEWATRPYFHPRAAVYEARLTEAALLSALHKAGKRFGERLYAWHGNLLFLTSVGHDSIPGSWPLAKRRYLERCVDLYGETLTTAGTHTNISLPEPLMMWEFMHLPDSERRDQHLDDYKSEFYITATRLLRAFAALFIATSASTPLQAQSRAGRAVVVLTENDSIRNLTFPNPPTLDLPDLYRSHRDYLQCSYDLVRRGLRFGNNNWMPVRARSFAEPVERLIAVTGDQLHALYARGLYSMGQVRPVEEMARQVEIENLLARINLPMGRVEVRTGDGGHPLDVDVANLTLMHLLLLRFFADADFARAFRYDREDVARARRNEETAARHGLRAEIENPLTAKPVAMRDLLSWTLAEMRPLAEAMGVWTDLAPLEAMAGGAGNTAERLRALLRRELGQSEEEVPVELLCSLAKRREAEVLADLDTIERSLPDLPPKTTDKLRDLFLRARGEANFIPQEWVRPQLGDSAVRIVQPDKTTEIVELARELIRIPSVTLGAEERLDEVRRASLFVLEYLRDHAVGVCCYDQGKYPAILAGFPGQMYAPVMLSGHFDVVAPEPDDSQFEPRVDGEYLWGRGAADMKTVVATYLVWLKDVMRQGPPFPPINLLLIGNEENGEVESMGTPHVLKLLEQSDGHLPSFFIAGERTGERGNEVWGEICTKNRGVMRFEVATHGSRTHSGIAGAPPDLTERLLQARSEIAGIAARHLTLSSTDGWHSHIRFPFVQVGTPGLYNITADSARFGVEVRPIPENPLAPLRAEIEAYCGAKGLELHVQVIDDGVVCDPGNTYLAALVDAVCRSAGEPPVIGRKLPGTSARFAPGGQGVVWGQTGVAPHGRDERHFIPSILPYYRALTEFSRALTERSRVSG